MGKMGRERLACRDCEEAILACRRLCVELRHHQEMEERSSGDRVGPTHSGRSAFSALGEGPADSGSSWWDKEGRQENYCGTNLANSGQTQTFSDGHTFEQAQGTLAHAPSFRPEWLRRELYSYAKRYCGLWEI